MSLSPYYRLSGISDELDLNLFVKRDDLLPDFLGGNKVRKNARIFDGLSKDTEVVITNGGAESNHARVCALMASRYGKKCHLVLHGSPLSSSFCNGNKFFIEASGAQVTHVEASEIGSMIKKLKGNYEAQGIKVDVIPGGGHSILGAKAYMDAVSELPEEPDYIFMASGTGATHAGIQAGVVTRGWKTKVIGISIARRKPRGKEAVEEVYYPLLKKELNSARDKCPEILFVDDYVCGGYSKYSYGLMEEIKELVFKTGLPLDPVYSGKAFVGMLDYLTNENIGSGTKVIFWHTGGLLNLQSSSNLESEYLPK
ncbi:pyridoxal-phosphate dependent enzyme [Idiomarina seosinensis]|uniref:1-aminocyclopropane-1-carboxylate deaminase/D-cysteine desulfhydrase n=1 Tax=Idiomarina seosinensis TaxID=281739 RepID=UPI00385050FA